MEPPGAVVLTPASEQNLAALRRGLRRAGGFALYLLVCDGPARAELVRRLRMWSGAEGVPELHFFAPGRPGAVELERFLAGVHAATPLSGAVIVDGDALVAAKLPVHALNAARDRLSELVAGPLVLIVSAASESKLGQLGVDLFDVRSATYELEVAPLSAWAQSTKPIRPPGPLTRVTRREPRAVAIPKASDLRALEGTASTPPSALADAWLKIAVASLANADLPAAKSAALEALRLARLGGYARGAAMAFSGLADVAERTGQVTQAVSLRREALDIYRGLADDPAIALATRELAHGLVYSRELWQEAEQMLRAAIGLYESMNDIDGRAAAQGELARILVGLDNFDEALRLCKEEVLPVYERSGDAVSRAVTMSIIADTFRGRGELGEALRIYREEVLPVYEESRHDFARAHTMGDIADILERRGELAEALRIRREEELPVYERLGDVWLRAHIFGRIAINLKAQGELQEALRIHREEELPGYEGVGPTMAHALALGDISDILEQLGDPEEALRVNRDEQIPILEQLDEAEALMWARTDLALRYLRRGYSGDPEAAKPLLALALRVAEDLQLPIAETLFQIREEHGLGEPT